MSEFALQHPTEIQNGAAYKVKAQHLTDNFNALKSDIDDRLSLTDTDPQTVAGAVEFDGQTTHDGGIKSDTISEVTAAAGVTADGVRMKDGMVKVAGTPAADGEIGYVSNRFAGRQNGSTLRFAMRGADILVWNTSYQINTSTLAGTATGAMYSCTGTLTLSFQASVDNDLYFVAYVKNEGAGIVTLDPNGTETIDGLSTLKLYPGESVIVFDTGGTTNYRTIGRQKGEILISRQTASNSTTIDFTTGLDDTEFDSFIFRLKNIVPATDATSMWMRFSTNAGSSYAAGGSDYVYAGLQPDSGGGSPSAISSTGAGQIQISGTSLMGNSTGEAYSADVTLPAPSNTAIYKHVNVIGGGYGATPRAASITVDGVYVGSTSAVNAVRFLMSSGNITSGTIELWGIRK